MTTVRSITLDVQQADTIDTVKMKIETLEGIPAYDQRLKFCGVELEDSLILSDWFDMFKQASIDLVVPGKIFIQISQYNHSIWWWGQHGFGDGLRAKTIALDVETTDTIHTVKSKIQDKVDIQVEHQHLISVQHPELQLDDESSLSEHGIAFGSTMIAHLAPPASRLVFGPPDFPIRSSKRRLA